MTDTEDVDGSTVNPPAGWYYERPDYGVGMNGGWLHEECPWWEDNYERTGPAPADVTVDALGPADVEVRGMYLTRLTCECGASVVVAER